VGWPGLLFFGKLQEENQVERHPCEYSVIRMLIVVGRVPVLMSPML
jgi:hypothetical protein